MMAALPPLHSDITVTLKCPLGLNVEPRRAGPGGVEIGCLVSGFRSLPGGGPGQIQRSGPGRIEYPPPRITGNDIRTFVSVAGR